MSAIKCSYKNCPETFASRDEMESHKRWSAEHNWCYKCDVDCEDYDDFLQHKVEAMFPWLYESHQHLKTTAPKHICCEFCGMDFKTFGGRRIHREEQHRGTQQIVCPGCGCIFISAFSMIQHLEKNWCKKISQADFNRALQWKHMFKQIMKDPDEIIHTLDFIAASSQDSICFSNEDLYNGVALFDTSTDLIALKIDPIRLKSQTDRLSTPSIHDSPINGVPEDGGLDDSMSALSVGTAWDQEAKDPAREEYRISSPRHSAALNSQNPRFQVLHRRFWDPESPDYNRSIFFHFGLEKYCCPLKDCSAAFESPTGIDLHFQEDHMPVQHRCPNSSCFKVFGSASDLIKHLENSTKCTIRQSESYKEVSLWSYNMFIYVLRTSKILDTITGGLLAAQTLPVPAIVDVNKIANQQTGRTQGLVRVAYTAKMPQDGRTSSSAVI